MKSDIRKWKSLPTEKLSSRVFYPLVVLCVLVFALFWFVGYDRVFADNPNFNDPLFTDVLLVLAYLLTLASVGLGAWSAYHTISLRGKSESLNNNIPVKKIGYSVVLGSLALMILTFVFGSAHAMSVNRVVFSDWFWLKLSDMFINTSLILLLVAIGAVVFGATRYIRR